MKTASIILIVLCLLPLVACGEKVNKQSLSQTTNSQAEKLVNAYGNRDWKTVVAIGDSLIGGNDSLNLTIPYSEALAALGNGRKALKVLDKELKSNPDDYYLYQTKGNVYYAMQKFDSAIVCYEKVIEMKPSYARPYIFLGEIYEINGKKQKAVENYLEAARLFADNGMTDEVLEFAHRVLSIDPTNVEADGFLNKFTR